LPKQASDTDKRIGKRLSADRLIKKVAGHSAGKKRWDQLCSIVAGKDTSDFWWIGNLTQNAGAALSLVVQQKSDSRSGLPDAVSHALDQRIRRRIKDELTLGGLSHRVWTGVRVQSPERVKPHLLFSIGAILISRGNGATGVVAVASKDFRKITLGEFNRAGPYSRLRTY
jgi:hypothetical protein